MFSLYKQLCCGISFRRLRKLYLIQFALYTFFFVSDKIQVIVNDTINTHNRMEMKNTAYVDRWVMLQTNTPSVVSPSELPSGVNLTPRILSDLDKAFTPRRHVLRDEMATEMQHAPRTGRGMSVFLDHLEACGRRLASKLKAGSSATVISHSKHFVLKLAHVEAAPKNDSQFLHLFDNPGSVNQVFLSHRSVEEIARKEGLNSLPIAFLSLINSRAGAQNVQEGHRTPASENEDIFSINAAVTSVAKLSVYTFNVHPFLELSSSGSGICLHQNNVSSVSGSVLHTRTPSSMADIFTRRSVSSSGSGVCSLLVSDIMVVTVSSTHHAHLTDPVTLVLRHKMSQPRKDSVECVFWDTHVDRWSGQGCRKVQSNATHTVCQCDHLSSFAIIMNVAYAEENAGSYPQKVLTLVLLPLSIIGHALSIATFLSFRNLHTDHNTIHVHTLSCLLVSQCLFLLAAGVTEMDVLCQTVAVLMHYSFLCSFSWMLLEGFSIYLMLLQPTRGAGKFSLPEKQLFLLSAFAYGIPLLIVIISLVSRFDDYGTELYCWLSSEHGLQWSFVGPVLFIIFINSLVLALAMYVMCKHSRTSQAMMKRSLARKLKIWVRGTVMLLVMMGVPYIFGILHLESNLAFFSYIFILLNASQGILVFICLCLLNRKVTAEYTRVFDPYLIAFTNWLPCEIPFGMALKEKDRRSTITNRAVVKEHSSSSADALSGLLAGWDFAGQGGEHSPLGNEGNSNTSVRQGGEELFSLKERRNKRKRSFFGWMFFSVTTGVMGVFNVSQADLGDERSVAEMIDDGTHSSDFYGGSFLQSAFLDSPECTTDEQDEEDIMELCPEDLWALPPPETEAEAMSMSGTSKHRLGQYSRSFTSNINDVSKEAGVSMRRCWACIHCSASGKASVEETAQRDAPMRKYLARKKKMMNRKQNAENTKAEGATPQTGSCHANTDGVTFQDKSPDSEHAFDMENVAPDQGEKGSETGQIGAKEQGKDVQKKRSTELKVDAYCENHEELLHENTEQLTADEDEIRMSKYGADTGVAGKNGSPSPDTGCSVVTTQLRESGSATSQKQENSSDTDTEEDDAKKSGVRGNFMQRVKALTLKKKDKLQKNDDKMMVERTLFPHCDSDTAIPTVSLSSDRLPESSKSSTDVFKGLFGLYFDNKWGSTVLSESQYPPSHATSKEFKQPTEPKVPTPLASDILTPVPETTDTVITPVPETTDTFRTPVPETTDTLTKPVPETTDTLRTPEPQITDTLRTSEPQITDTLRTPEPQTTDTLRTQAPETSQPNDPSSETKKASRRAIFRREILRIKDKLKTPVPETSQPNDSSSETKKASRRALFRREILRIKDKLKTPVPETSQPNDSSSRSKEGII
ncbi:uncharacterized protein [Littorina saxatilis]|uniref:uncharacterized protein n=1 Tax=Littorina saxatilis TaxID=31220 RepID=UPI0038B61AD2